MIQILELLDKDFKTTIIKMLQQAFINTLGTNGKMQSLGKERENVKINQMKILE